MKLLFAIGIGAIVGLAAEGPVREVVSQATLIPLQSTPGFQRGYFFWLDQSTVHVYPPDGGVGIVRVLEIPGVATPTANGLAVDSDGSVAVSVWHKSTGGTRGGLAFLDAAGRQTGYLDTGLYMPSNLYYGEDHSLWTFGWQLDPNQPDHPDPQDYPTVRKYSANRQEAGRYLPRSLFPKGLSPGLESWQRLRIVVAHDRVGLLAWSGNSSKTGEWVELDLSGSPIRRVPINNISHYGIAFTDDGHLYRQKDGTSQLEVLDGTTPDWKPAGSGHAFRLWGADGNLLVFSSFEHGPIHAQWYEQPRP